MPKIAPKGLNRLFFILVSTFFAAGCAGLPPYYVRVLPAPVRTFPPVEPALVRLPVEIIFPSGGDVVRHVVNLVKNELRPKMTNTTEAPEIHSESHIKDFWSVIQNTIFLDKGAWLLIRPQALSVGWMKGDSQQPTKAHAVLEMTANPEIIFGPKPFTTPATMPPLGKFVRGPDTFQAISNTRISYQEANQFLRDPRMKLIGMVLPGMGDQKVVLQGLRFYGSGGKVIVEVKLRYNPLLINLGGKPAKLTVYLQGTPRYLPKERVFELTDLDYDIKSGDLMVQVADWLFKSDFKNQLRHIARLPIGPKMDLMKAKVDIALNRSLGPFARLSTQVKSFKVIDGFADNEGVVARLFIQGTSALQVIWK
jgi:hypothetical protein